MKFISFSLGSLVLISCIAVEAPSSSSWAMVPLPELTQEFLSTESTLLASKVILRVRGDFYEKIAYRVDQNFHTFVEERDSTKILMTLSNSSGLLNHPLRMWIDHFQIVATDRIEVVFGEGRAGILIRADGEVFWHRDEKVVRAQRMVVQDGEIQFFGQE